MRRIAFWITLPLLMALMLSLTAGLALAELGPFHPGDGLYPLQHTAEQMLITLTPDPSAQVETMLEMLERRTADLGNPKDKAVALEQFDLAFNQAIGALVNAPETRGAKLRTQTMSALAKAHAILIQLAASNPAQSEEYLARRDFIEALLRSLVDLGRPLNALLTNSNGQPEMGLLDAVAARSATPSSADPQALTISPHFVTFPAGSIGALHLFFPLDGNHATIDCIQCHTTGQYAGTPSTCSACHNAIKPVPHYPGECSACHTSEAWKPAIFNHAAAQATDCLSCHAQKRPANHWPGQCAACHSTNAWKPATFNHAAAKATDCLSCHAQKRPANHWPGQCAACHSTNAWKPATFNHAAAQATDCLSCHTQNRPANHWSGQCAACHSTNAWKPATFNHAVAKSTDCLSCHAQKRPANHYQGQCVLCHNTSNWKQATFNHAAVSATNCLSCHVQKRPANHWQGECSACHSTSAWKPANFNHVLAGATDCQGCHTRPANHFQGQCSTCHSTNGWKPANFNHSFPMNHGKANGKCAACHTNGDSGPANCFLCHNKPELDNKHVKKKIANYETRCLECHANGKK